PFTVQAQPNGLWRVHTLGFRVLPEFTICSLITQFDSSTVYAKHFLFSNKESLQLRIFLDNSLLEVHANERTSLATHIYPVLNTSTQVGYAVSNGAGVQVTVIGRDLSKANVWPQRPINTSVPLVYDTAAETNNYTYWTGN
ncbi:unnamed protein product, partial [Didymodactylos carnosus]